MSNELESLKGRVCVVIPDYMGNGITHANGHTQQFMPAIEKLCFDNSWRLAIITNGPKPEAIRDTVEQGRQRLLKAGFLDKQLYVPSPMTNETGVVGAAKAGYDYFLASTDDSIVVKMDHAEHPAAPWVPRMVNMVRNGGWDTVFGDLHFDGNNFKQGAKDKEANDVLAGICRSIGFRFTLTNAHGFQAYKRSALETVLPVAKQIHDQAGTILSYLNTPNRWGFDMAMILAAQLEGIEQQQVLVTPGIDRLRDDDLDYCNTQLKISSQMQRWNAVAMAYNNLRLNRLQDQVNQNKA